MNKCTFCQILRDELPASFVYEDGFCRAFLDIHPINEGHVLVIPKEHQAQLSQLSPDSVGHLLRAGQAILQAIQKSEIRCEGANLFLSDGAVAGQEVMHCHLHIVPRFAGDGQKVGFSHAEAGAFPRERLDKIAERIKVKL